MLTPETVTALQAALLNQQPEYNAWGDQRLREGLARIRRLAKEARQRRRERGEKTG